MQAQPKYQSEVTTVVMGERTITIKNLTPILPPTEREKRKREVEQKLFDVLNRFLEKNYSTVNIYHEHSIAYFWCKK